MLLCRCILSKFYIKPQLRHRHSQYRSCCILSKFYIKPQLRLERELARCVVSYRNSTSNHNSTKLLRMITLLYLIEILHQTTTQSTVDRNAAGCILSKFYIKPQLFEQFCRLFAVVSYRNSTSNHNPIAGLATKFVLYLIEILHQTTTSPRLVFCLSVLYLIEILHQTTTFCVASL